jgi:hypothetical protein
MPDKSLQLLSNVDFRRLNSKEFKEDSVREEIILPLLHYLGYAGDSIVRSKTLQHPFVKIGTSKRPVTLIPSMPVQMDFFTYYKNKLIIVSSKIIK